MANNPYVNKVQKADGTVLIDLSNDTVAANKMLSGTTAHDKSGAAVTGNIQTQAAQTITPGTTDQTIASGKYLTGAQTIKGDANLVEGNIKKDVQIFGVTGTHEGGGKVESKDVDFYDYDGTLLYSYTAAEFANLSAMPANPSHDGLTAQGWNWTLADAKAYVAKYNMIDIGQMYVTSDGKTRIYYEIDCPNTTIGIYLKGSAANSVDIDWGDGSTHDTVGSNRTEKTHTYSAAGKYVVGITVASGNTCTIGGGSSYYGLKTKGALAKKIEIGNGIDLQSYSFSSAYSLETITIPNNYQSIPDSCFSQCHGLKHITFPSNITSLGNSAVYYNYSLRSVCFPKNLAGTITSSTFYYCPIERICISEQITSMSSIRNCNGLKRVAIPKKYSLSDSMFNYCRTLEEVNTNNEGVKLTESVYDCFANCVSLQKIIISADTTKIHYRAFDACYSMKEYHILATTPPTLTASSAIYVRSDTKIYVPAASLSAYKSASNWSSLESYMVGE